MADPALSPELLAAHKRLLADRALQFDLSVRPAPPPPAEVPAWLKALGKMLEALGGPLEILFWAAVGFAVGFLIFYIVREVRGARWASRSRGADGQDAPTPAWRPNAAYARLQLAEADRLASEGRFDEAAHHLLLHGIQDVQDRRPRSIRPALTSREITRLPVLPETARAPLQTLTQVVEESLFGGRRLGAAEFESCRAAYAAFALPEVWA